MSRTLCNSRNKETVNLLQLSTERHFLKLLSLLLQVSWRKTQFYSFLCQQFGLSLQQIMDVDEKDQIMMTNVWLNLVRHQISDFPTIYQGAKNAEILSTRKQRKYPTQIKVLHFEMKFLVLGFTICENYHKNFFVLTRDNCLCLNNNSNPPSHSVFHTGNYSFEFVFTN